MRDFQRIQGYYSPCLDDTVITAVILNTHRIQTEPCIDTAEQQRAERDFDHYAR